MFHFIKDSSNRQMVTFTVLLSSSCQLSYILYKKASVFRVFNYSSFIVFLYYFFTITSVLDFILKINFDMKFAYALVVIALGS